jgi:hypothetical protein
MNLSIGYGPTCLVFVIVIVASLGMVNPAVDRMATKMLNALKPDPCGCELTTLLSRVTSATMLSIEILLKLSLAVILLEK